MAPSLFKWLSFSVFLFLNKAVGLSKAHPLYVTVTEINYNAKDKTLEISCKIFTNDFEAALEKAYHQRIDITEPKDIAAANKFVSGYIQKHFQIKVDGKPVVLEFIGSERQVDATWSYFQVNNVSVIKKLEITNSLLYDTFEGQIGIMHVMVSGNRQSTKITNPETNAVFEF